MNIIPISWLPKANMKRIICHWTAGSHQASGLDKKHYHILIEGDGTLVRGTHTITDNESTADGNYAAHTLGTNTGSIGISVCCMSGATEHPFDPGSFPMTERQWRKMAQVAAELCRVYSIEIKPTTVLGHGEVEGTLNIKQKGKWDPMVLPWNPRLTHADVGNRFRELVKTYMDGIVEDDKHGADIGVSINGKSPAGSLLANETVYVKVKSLLAEDMGWTLFNVSADTLVLLPQGREEVIYLSPEFLDPNVSIPEEAEEVEILTLVSEKGYVRASQLAEELNLPMRFNEAANSLEIGDQAAPAPAPAMQRVIVKSGDTLSAIAARYLGNALRWKELLDAEGKSFNGEKARKIRPGDVVFLPGAAEGQDEKSAGDEAPDSHGVVSVISAFDIDELIEAANPVLHKYARVSVPVIVAECVASGVTDHAQVAYVLATSEHESLAGKFMTEIWGPTKAQRKYEGRQDLGNTRRGDGFRYRGRGYVQVTGRTNYEKWKKRLNEDLVSNPDLVSANPGIAAKILVQGMRDGAFRGGHKLSEYFGAGNKDFYNARDMINGDKAIIDSGQTLDRGTRIVNIASRYLAAM
ncbi:MAG: N-acetylmuramoyl-L-alanine amidase [Gammaproteobacteria bacterium]